MTIANFSELAQGISALATTLAIIVGAVWTYFMFVRKRIGMPKLTIQLETEVLKLNNDERLVSIMVQLKNTSLVLFGSERAELRVLRVRSANQSEYPFLSQKKNAALELIAAIEWPQIHKKEWLWQTGQFEIEPGEQDVLYTDFVVGSQLELIKLDIFVANPNKKKNDLGWVATKFVNLT